MKKVLSCFLLLIVTKAYSQIPLQWKTAAPTKFTISNADISANSLTGFSDYANSKQLLSMNQDGAVEFKIKQPAAGNYYQIGFAKASSPNTMIVGFHVINGSDIYLGGAGQLFSSYAPTYTNTFINPYFTASSGTTPSVAIGTKLKIERVNNVIHFWNVTANVEMFYVTPTSTPLAITPTEDWVVFFGNASTSGTVTGVYDCTSSFSGLPGEEKLWTRTASNTIRPLSLADKVGIGKDPVVNLDVQGSARISSLAGTNALLETDASGNLNRKAMSTAGFVLAGDGTWTAKSSFAQWQNAASPSGAVYFQPAANPYIGINTPVPSANVDIYDTRCDNRPSLKIVVDEITSCSPGVSDNFIDCQTVNTGGSFGITSQRFVVQQNGFVGINRTPLVTLDVAGNIRATGTITPSDKRFKDDIKNIDQPLALVKQIVGKTYRYKTEEFPTWNFEAGKHYGFIAQELKKVLPELVKEDKEGNLGVNYVMVIPLLTEAIKEQQQQIEVQQKAIEELTALVKGKQGSSVIDDALLNDMAAGSLLSQNVPNPFTRNTEIRYLLPRAMPNANIGVYDLNGKEMKLYPLSAKEGTVTIEGGNLQPGMYIYTLLVNGTVLQSKKMVLTSQ